MSYMQFTQALKSLDKAPRREEVLHRVLRGEKDADIANEMGIHPGTVRKQLSNLYEIFRLDSEFPRDKSSNRILLAKLFAKHKPDLLREGKYAYLLPEEKGEPILDFLNISPPTGILSLNSPLYIERKPDEDVKQAFHTHADESKLFIRIKGSKGMGKSSLLVHLRQFLEVEQNYAVGLVDLSGKDFGSEILSDLSKLLYQFTYAVAQAFKPALGKEELPDLKRYWRDDIAPGLNCTDYLHEYVFTKINRSKTLLIDGIDTVLGHEPAQSQFLNLLRSWNEEKMKLVSQEKIIWSHIIIAYSTEPYASYGLESSPLHNVGMPVKLPEFTEEQVLQQAQKYQLNWDLSQVKRLRQLIGGHPELVNRALYQISKNQIELDELLSQACQYSSPFSDYLLEHLRLLQEHPRLSKCYEKIINGETCYDEFAKFQLEKAGLIKIDKNKASASFELYQEYFCKHLQSNNGN